MTLAITEDIHHHGSTWSVFCGSWINHFLSAPRLIGAFPMRSLFWALVFKCHPSVIYYAVTAFVPTSAAVVLSHFPRYVFAEMQRGSYANPTRQYVTSGAWGVTRILTAAPLLELSPNIRPRRWSNKIGAFKWSAAVMCFNLLSR